jgi:hypothetical protein
VSDATIYAGDKAVFEVTVRNEDGSAVPMAGITAKYKAVPNVGDGPGIEKSSEGGGIVLSEVDGTVVLTITLESADTELPPGAYKHEVEIMDSIDAPYTVMTGKLRIQGTLIK